MTPLEIHQAVERLKLQKEQLVDELRGLDQSDPAYAQIAAEKTAQVAAVTAEINELRQSLLRMLVPPH